MHSLYDIKRRNARPVKSLAEHEADANMLADSLDIALRQARVECDTLKATIAERDEAIYLLREELEAKNGALALFQRRVDELRATCCSLSTLTKSLEHLLQESIKRDT